RAMQWLEGWVYRKADFVNAVTPGIARTLCDERVVPAFKLLRLANGVDTELFRPAAPDEELIDRLGLSGKRIFLYQGTLGYAHALENTLRAAAILREERDIHFVFLGNGSERAKLVRMATALSLENTSFLDFVPVEQVADFLSIACCGLASLRDIPIFQDARPSKLFPILASGKPVIFCGPKGETSRFLEEKTAGIVAPADDPAALAAAIREIAANPHLAVRLGENGRRYAEESLKWSKLVSDWIAELRSGEPPNRMVA
ncbi:MAG: glycosyltransferase family 4 protein, partial [Candidatus Acidiferrales bacterium]